MEIQRTYTQQKAFFCTNKSKEVTFRIEQLIKLKKILKAHEKSLYNAIYEDFGKSEFETYISEISALYHEINTSIKHVKKWSKKRRVKTDISNFPARSYILPEPLGTTLVIGAWNYPYRLSLLPAMPPGIP